MSSIIVPSRKLWTPPRRQRGFFCLPPGVGMIRPNGGGGGDPYWANVVSLLHFDAADASTTFTDQTGKTWTGNGNAQIDTSQSMFGGSALQLDGTGDYLTTPSSSAWDISNNNYTVESFIRPANVTSLRTIISRRESGGNALGWHLYIGADGSLNFAGYTAANTLGITLTSAASVVAINTWAHVAAVRAAGAWYLFYGGALAASATETALVNDYGTTLAIGRQLSNTGRDFNGWIDEVRITKGVARYTSAFTPPTAAFPNS